jgi:eukaryotic-like serine/threonine-protein kinase
MAEDIAAALAHVHAAGLVHCDVKPANIMVQDSHGQVPRAMLLDLGLSTARGITGQARGTLAYMSREALAGAVDPRSDLYALGATLYHAITGAPPFAATSPRTLIRAICEQAVPPLVAPWLPEPLKGCIMRLLCRDPGDRHSSAQVLLQDLTRIREALGLTLPEPRTRWPGRHANAGRAPAALLPPRLIGRDATVAALPRGHGLAGPEPCA